MIDKRLDRNSLKSSVW